MALRHFETVIAAGMAMLPAMLLSAAAIWGWGRFWDTIVGRSLLAGMLVLIAIVFSPLFLFCLDWHRLQQLCCKWWPSGPSTFAREK
jgi:hypothetical protein